MPEESHSAKVSLFAVYPSPQPWPGGSAARRPSTTQNAILMPHQLSMRTAEPRSLPSERRNRGSSADQQRWILLEEDAGIADFDTFISVQIQKVMVAREGTDDDQRWLSALWREASFRMLDVSDEELLDMQPLTVEVPTFARIFDSATCSICGESVMEPRARMRDGNPICMPCSGHEYYQLSGDGISLAYGTA